MANRSADFNYKVALASGAKSLKGGRLRQAEEQFRYLVKHFPGAEGGYRGLAKVFVEQEDRPGALRMLLEGGAALAKANQRANAVALYHEAITLEPRDLAAHRRLASALALSGETEAAAHEYIRYIKHSLDAQDKDRAMLEASYALELLPGNREIEEIARSIGTVIPKPRESKADREALMRTAFTAASPSPSAPARADRERVATASTSTDATPAAASAWDAPAPSIAHAPSPSAASWSGSAPSASNAWDAPASGGDGGWATSNASEPAPLGADADALAVEAAAARYLAKGDPRGGEAALEAARRYIVDGRMDAASDLLLQLIAAGVADHDAQRLLVEVTRSLGKRDVAKVKVKLLVQALRLDGRNELAAEVEELAQAI